MSQPPLSQASAQHLARLFRLSILCALYLPGTIFTSSVGQKRALLVYCIFPLLLNLLISLDQLMLSMSNQLPVMDRFGALFLFIGFFWCCVLRLFFFYNGSSLVKLIAYWKENLVPPAEFAFEREALMSKMNRNVELTTRWLTGLVAGPMLLVALFKLISSTTGGGSLYFRSTLDSGNYQILTSTDFKLLIFQAANTISVNVSWIMSEAVMFQVIGLIQVELQFLVVCIRHILKSGSPLTNVKISKWIQYHSTVIKFAFMVNGVLRSYLLGYFAHIAIANCGLIFNTVAVKMPFEVFLLSYVYVMPRIVMTYRLCAVGHTLTSLNECLLNELERSNWCELSTRLRRDFLIIREVCLKQSKTGLVIPPRTSLNLHTFQRALLVQYRFFTFLRDMERRSLNKQIALI